MRRALIGHTGFVGSNLLAKDGFTHTFNSSNIDAMRQQYFDEVVCCGVSAVKWQANADPKRDWANISRLLEVLETLEAGTFTLVSTIDVYPDPACGLDERAVLTGLPNHAYGRHRLEVEQRVAARFPRHAIIRLPALFGNGLKKNIVFDLLHRHRLADVNPAAAFQWYPLDRLASDIALCWKFGLPLLNLFTEPLPTQTILDCAFPGLQVSSASGLAPRYDTRTAYGPAFGGIPGYIMAREEVLSSLCAFVEGALP